MRTPLLFFLSVVTLLTPADASDYTFKAIKIVPSPVDGEYTGHFRFVNHRSKPVPVSGWDKPDRGGRFVPRFIGFEVLADGSWKDREIGYCGTGQQDFDMKPKVPYEFVCGLGYFKEQEAPLTARIRVGDFISEPFVLDWKKDRASGAFAAARKRNFQEVRSAFAKAGFKPELIKGDNFCERVLRSMMRAADSGKEDSFVGLKGKLNVSPQIELDGNIRIDFTSEETKDRETQYQGWLLINPNKFNPTWLKTTAREHVRASRRDAGVIMELDDGSDLSGADVHLYLSINYDPPAEIWSVPTAEKAEAMFLKMLDNLEQWLK